MNELRLDKVILIFVSIKFNFCLKMKIGFHFMVVRFNINSQSLYSNTQSKCKSSLPVQAPLLNRKQL